MDAVDNKPDGYNNVTAVLLCKDLQISVPLKQEVKIYI